MSDRVFALWIKLMLAFGLAAVLIVALTSRVGANESIDAGTNQIRQSLGLSKLQTSAALTQYAEAFAQKIGSCEPSRCFGHDIPALNAYVTSHFDCWQLDGSNIAFGQADEAAVVAAWRNSPEHYANMINPAFDLQGSAKVKGYNGAYYYVQVFVALCDAPVTHLAPPPPPTPVHKETPKPTPTKAPVKVVLPDTSIED